jgi:hypothetical protein
MPETGRVAVTEGNNPDRLGKPLTTKEQRAHQNEQGETHFDALIGSGLCWALQDLRARAARRQEQNGTDTATLALTSE